MDKFHNKALGKSGEDFAVEYLKKQGFKILDRNWHYSKFAEVDIIALDETTLVFVEVKTRKNLMCGHPFEAVDYRKLEKIRMAMTEYISQNKIKFKDFRIDVIGLVGEKSFEIEHIRGVGV